MNKQDLNRAISQNSRSLVSFTEIEAARKAVRSVSLSRFHLLNAGLSEAEADLLIKTLQSAENLLQDAANKASEKQGDSHHALLNMVDAFCANN
jgi:hypothetical protein